MAGATYSNGKSLADLGGAPSKSGNLKFDQQFNSTLTPGLHSTAKQGYAADLTGVAGSGDWVNREALIPMLFSDNIQWDKLFKRYSLFANLVRREQSKIANALNLPDFTGGNPITIIVEAPFFAQKLAKACEIPISEIGVKTYDIRAGEYLGGAIKIRCGCTPNRRCSTGKDHMFSRDHFKSKLMEAMSNSLEVIDHEILLKLQAKANTALAGNGATRYEQILHGLAELTDGMFADVTKQLSATNLHLSITDFRYVIFANPYTIMELQLTPIAQQDFRFDHGTFGNLRELGLKGHVQGIPVIEVPTSVVDTTDAWMIMPLDTLALSIGCEDIYQTPDALVSSDGTKVLVDQTAYAFRIAYGIVELDFLYGAKLKGLKGKALDLTKSAMALPVNSVTAATTQP